MERNAAPEAHAAAYMSEFLRKYWFICLLSVCLLGVLIFYIVDLNKDNVKAMKADGSDVVASLEIDGETKTVTSEQLYDDYQNFNSTLLYNMYRNAVISQSVEADADMKSQAKTLAKSFKTTMDSDSTNKSRYSIISELASYGFKGEESLEDYSMLTLKARKLDQEYIDAHFDEVKDEVKSSPRTISIITMNVPNADILTDEAQQKKDSIDKALEEGQDFGETATAFSEDTTASKAGFYGYIDSNTTDLDSAVVTAATALNPGEVSDWISVQPQGSAGYVMYRVKVEETDLRTLIDSDDTEVSTAAISAVITAKPSLEVDAVVEAAKKLDITFDDENVKKVIEDYIQEQTGGSEE